ncbi:MAG: dihydrofolate reductase family protein, partial [Jatrophihabitantaceae bacterium]
ARAAVAARADVLVCGDDDIDYAAVRHALAARGLTRVLCEGGPTILGRVLTSGELDELCLSVSPSAAGPGAGRIVAGAEWEAPRTLRLAGLLEEDGALFLRYRR